MLLHNPWNYTLLLLPCQLNVEDEQSDEDSEDDQEDENLTEALEHNINEEKPSPGEIAEKQLPKKKRKKKKKKGKGETENGKVVNVSGFWNYKWTTRISVFKKIVDKIKNWIFFGLFSSLLPPSSLPPPYPFSPVWTFSGAFIVWQESLYSLMTVYTTLAWVQTANT